MKVIIAGGRDFNDYNLLKSSCNTILVNQKEIEIVSGTANGADKLGERYAEDMGYLTKQFPADWDRHGKKAGFIRNRQMAEYADALIAFWGGRGKGTEMMISIARTLGLKVRVIRYN